MRGIPSGTNLDPQEEKYQILVNREYLSSDPSVYPGVVKIGPSQWQPLICHVEVAPVLGRWAHTLNACVLDSRVYESKKDAYHAAIRAFNIADEAQSENAPFERVSFVDASMAEGERLVREEEGYSYFRVVPQDE